MANDNTPEQQAKQVALFWESEVVRSPSGDVTVKAIQPVSHMSRKQAARALGCTMQVITDLFRHGMLSGYKPGGWRVRKDGKASNAALRLNADSVLRYKQRQEQAAKEWQDAQ